MTGKEMKIVRHAVSTETRIIAYSNNKFDEVCLVAEKENGKINIFFEKIDSTYCDSERYSNSVEKLMKSVIYFLSFNFIYSLWISVNKVILETIEVGNSSKELLIIFFFNLCWIIILYLLCLKNNKYGYIFISIIIIDNLLKNNVMNFFNNVLITYKIIILSTLVISAIIGSMIYFLNYIDCKESISLKSKHSAEHMMCNYIEKYQTYPQNIRELRKSSRIDFCCGGLSGDAIFEEVFASIIANCLVIRFIIFLFERLNLNIIVGVEDKNLLIVSSLILMLYFLITDTFTILICRILIIFSQLISTSPKRKVEYSDLKMAQMLSKEFIKWQYPNQIEQKKKTK